MRFTRIQYTNSATKTCLGIVPIHWNLTPQVWVPCEEKFHNSLFICKLHGRNNKAIRYFKDLLECDTNSTFMQINRLAEIFCYEVIKIKMKNIPFLENDIIFNYTLINPDDIFDASQSLQFLEQNRLHFLLYKLLIQKNISLAYVASFQNTSECIYLYPTHKFVQDTIPIWSYKMVYCNISKNGNKTVQALKMSKPQIYRMKEIILVSECSSRIFISSLYNCTSSDICSENIFNLDCYIKQNASLGHFRLTTFLCNTVFTIFWSYVCDVIVDCPNGKDENELICPELKNPRVFVDTDATYSKYMDWSLRRENIQTVPCLYSSESFLLKDMCVYDTLLPAPCLDYSNLYYCLDFQCPGFFKCKESYCVPLRSLCNGYYDCPEGEDEHEVLCSQRVCEGLFLCVTERLCLHPKEVCDGIIHCPLSQDDEYMCPVIKCPTFCQCLRHIYVCENTNSSFITITDMQTRVLLLSGNSFISLFDIHKFSFLFVLDISKCNINFLGPLSFANNVYLLKLNVSYNLINQVYTNTFKGLRSLIDIDLQGNFISTIHEGGFADLYSLQVLNLSHLNIYEIKVKAFVGCYNMTILDLSWNRLKYLIESMFDDLIKLKFLHVNGNSLRNLCFNYLSNIHIIFLFTNDIKVCCIGPEAPCWVNNRSSNRYRCGNTQNKLLSLILIVTAGLLIFVSSFTVFLSAILTSGKRDLIFKQNKCVCDGLMGLYVFLMTATNVELGSWCNLNTYKWKQSLMCNLASIIFLTSWQTSLMIMVFEVFIQYKVVVSIRQKRLFCNSGLVCCSIAWIVGLGFAVIQTNFIIHSNSLCISLAMNTDWNNYFVFYFILNCIFMVFICICNWKLITKLNTVRKNVQRKVSFKDRLVICKVISQVVHYLLLWIVINWVLIVPRNFEYHISQIHQKWIFSLSVCFIQCSYEISVIRLAVLIYKNNVKKMTF